MEIKDYCLRVHFHFHSLDLQDISNLQSPSTEHCPAQLYKEFNFSSASAFPERPNMSKQKCFSCHLYWRVQCDTAQRLGILRELLLNRGRTKTGELDKVATAASSHIVYKWTSEYLIHVAPHNLICLFQEFKPTEQEQKWTRKGWYLGEVSHESFYL